MGQEIAKDTRRPKAEAKRMAGGQVTGHEVTDEERLRAWEEQTTADELHVLSAVHAEAKAYAACSLRRPTLAAADKARAARIAVAEAQRQRSVWGISDLCLEIHRALPVGATPADITEVAMLAISGTVGADVVQISPAPDLIDVSSLGIRQSDGQSILRKPNTMRWTVLTTSTSKNTLSARPGALSGPRSPNSRSAPSSTGTTKTSTPNSTRPSSACSPPTGPWRC